ncbi:MAG: hypothetical protein WBC50_08510 [Dehalococcoidales bacterium]
MRSSRITKFLSLKSRLTLSQAFAWAIIAILLATISTEGSFQAYFIYQKSLDYADFCFNLAKHWLMNLIF